MEQKSFGRSNLTVTPLGLGLAALGRPGYINLGHGADLGQNYAVETMEAHAHRMLDAAWEAGLRYFDAARSYGRSEQFLAGWLSSRQIEPGEVTIGSKWGYTYTANWQVNLPAGQKHEIKEHSLPVLLRQWQETQKFLGPHLAIYHVHSATLQSGVLKNQAVLAQLAELRNEGIVVGISVSGTGQAETMWEALEIHFDGVPLFGSFQATWNILEQSTTAVLNAAHDEGVGIIIKEALANGRLTPRNNAPAFQKKLSLLQELAYSYDTTIDAVALAAVLNQTFADVVLSGAAQVEHLQTNLAAEKIEWHAEIAEGLLGLREETAVYWQLRSQLPWN